MYYLIALYLYTYSLTFLAILIFILLQNLKIVLTNKTSFLNLFLIMIDFKNRLTIWIFLIRHFQNLRNFNFFQALNKNSDLSSFFYLISFNACATAANASYFIKTLFLPNNIDLVIKSGNLSLIILIKFRILNDEFFPIKILIFLLQIF